MTRLHFRSSHQSLRPHPCVSINYLNRFWFSDLLWMNRGYTMLKSMRYKTFAPGFSFFLWKQGHYLLCSRSNKKNYYFPTLIENTIFNERGDRSCGRKASLFILLNLLALRLYNKASQLFSNSDVECLDRQFNWRLTVKNSVFYLLSSITFFLGL